MDRQIIVSKDGSHTIYVPGLDEHYHSVHGALNESEHIFIRECLLHSQIKSPVIFEVGFGTGLNAILSLQAALHYGLTITYYAIEKYPLEKDEWSALNYGQLLTKEIRPYFSLIHESDWNCSIPLHKSFTLFKIQDDLKSFEFTVKPDLVYFDAFSPDVQPSLWTAEVFVKIYDAMNVGGQLTTYSVKGSVRRTLEACGYRTEKIKGPPGKREILRAIK